MHKCTIAQMHNSTMYIGVTFFHNVTVVACTIVQCSMHEFVVMSHVGSVYKEY